MLTEAINLKIKRVHFFRPNNLLIKLGVSAQKYLCVIPKPIFKHGHSDFDGQDINLKINRYYLHAMTGSWA